MAKVMVTGSKGFIATPVVKLLKEKGYYVCEVDKDYCDLAGSLENIVSMLEFEKPDAIIHCAGKVGGIMANKTRPYDYLFENLYMNTNFLEACRKTGQRRVLYTMCGCSYPSKAPNPIREEYLFAGKPDENSLFYAMGKAVNHLQCVAARRQFNLDWSTVIPGNAYGPGDNFDPENSHVVAGMINKFHKAKINGATEITLWGNGFPLRDFVYVDDVAEGIVLALEKHHMETPINLSSGIGTSIGALANIVKDVVGFTGEIKWDVEKPGGQITKVFDVSHAENILGWRARTALRDGITKIYEWFLGSKWVADDDKL